MFSFMLEPRLPRFKTLWLVTSLVGSKQGKAIVEEYDKKIFVSYVFQVSLSFASLVEFEKGVVDQKVEKDNNLDTFEMTTNISEQVTELINKEFLIFKHY
jgi:hypothetical protein